MNFTISQKGFWKISPVVAPILAGSVLIGLFVFQKIYLQLPDFGLDPVDASGQLRLQWYTIASALFLFLLWRVAVAISLPAIPYRAYLAIIITVFSVVSIIAIATHPIYSQDTYWNLLMGKAFSQHHANPYTATPSFFPEDSWNTSVGWQQSSMPYGPIWTLILFPITAFTDSREVALISLKLGMFAALG